MQKTLLLFLLLCSTASQAQNSDFISRGMVEYEMKINQKMAMRRFREQMGDDMSGPSNIPDYITSYYNLNFSWNTAVYSAGRQGNLGMSDKKTAYIDLSAGTYTARKYLFGAGERVYTDSLSPLPWKILNETRNIAGFECRKAVAMLPDSVYVIAFYSQQIMPQMGPELFNGLPGMILGLAVPQWYTTWFATKLELAQLNEEAIKPPSPGKGKVYTTDELMAEMYKENKVALPDSITPARMKSMFFNRYRL